MTASTNSRHDPQPEADDAGTVAADCYRLAGQIRGGVVRAALLEMGRDYTARARDTARTAKFRVALAHSQQAATGFWPLRILAELFAPLPTEPVRCGAAASRRTTPVAVARPPAQRAPAQRAPAQRAAAPAAAPARTKPAARTSRLFRLHALGVVES